MNTQVQDVWLQILREPSTIKCVRTLSQGSGSYCAEGALAEAFMRCFPEEGYSWDGSHCKLVYVDNAKGISKAWEMDLPKQLRMHQNLQAGELFIQTSEVQFWLKQRGLDEVFNSLDPDIELIPLWFLNDCTELTLHQIADIIEEIEWYKAVNVRLPWEEK